MSGRLPTPLAVLIVAALAVAVGTLGFGCAAKSPRPPESAAPAPGTEPVAETGTGAEGEGDPSPEDVVAERAPETTPEDPDATDAVTDAGATDTAPEDDAASAADGTAADGDDASRTDPATVATTDRPEHDGAEPADDAPAEDSWNPAPFHATYRVRYEGVPVTATGTRTLRRNADGTLRFASHIETWFLDVDESARFEITADGEVRPLSYDYQQSGIGRDRRRILEFDHEAEQLRRSGDREREQALPVGALDPVSWQLALARDVARGRTDDLLYPVTDGGEPKLYRLAVRGEEAVTVASGSVERAVRIERIFEAGDDRHTRIWLAPDRDWLIVRFEHRDEDGRVLQLSLLEQHRDATAATPTTGG